MLGVSGFARVVIVSLLVATLGACTAAADGQAAVGPPPAGQTPAPRPPPPSPSATPTPTPPPELPGGGRVLFPDRRVVAYYGGALTPALGVLGETPPEEAGARVAAAAAPFDRPERPVLPAFELIATVASGVHGPDGLYRNTTDDQVVQRYLDAARQAGALLLLDIQPGRSDFLTEARRYERFLREPDVGLALDPEWRMGPDQVPGRTIGSVSAEEVNAVAAYLVGLVRDGDLPQKLLVVHQFRASMVEGRERIAAPPELAVTFHIDGFGTQGQKLETYDTLQTPPPFSHGFKLFYDEDTTLFTPEQVLGLAPSPDLITYQ